MDCMANGVWKSKEYAMKGIEAREIKDTSGVGGKLS